MKFITTYVHNVYHQSVVLKLLGIFFHNKIVSKITAVSGPERQVPHRPVTNQTAGFHVPDLLANIVI